MYQTFNAPSYGPTFGGGHDLYVGSDLSIGYSYLYSYGATGSQTQQSIVDGSMYDGANLRIDGLETFTVAIAPPVANPLRMLATATSNAVPEPGSLALFGLAIIGLIVSKGPFGRRRRDTVEKPATDDFLVAPAQA